MIQKNKGWNIAANISMCILSFLALAPFVLLVIASLTDDKVALAKGYHYIPEKCSLEAYDYIFSQSGMLGRAYLMTVLLTGVGTAIGVSITSLLAYALSKRELPGRKLLNFFVVFTMLFNGGLVSARSTMSSGRGRGV